MRRSTLERSSILRASGAAALVLSAIGLCAPPAHSAMLATDNASNYASGGWTSSNLGSGFGPWNVVTTDSNNPPYSGTYLGNGGGDAYAAGQIGTAGYVWGTYSNNPDATNANRVDLYRTFTVNPLGYQDPSGNGTLYNQTFSVSLLTYGVGNGTGGPPNSAMGFSLDTGTGAGALPVLTLEYSGTNSGDSGVLIDNDGSDVTSGLPGFSAFNNGIVVTVSVGSNPDGVNPYTLDIYNNTGSTLLYTYSNTTTGPIQQVDLFDANTTENGYFNNLNVSPEVAVVPEPASLATLGLSSLILVRRRRRA